MALCLDDLWFVGFMVAAGMACGWAYMLVHG